MVCRLIKYSKYCVMEKINIIYRLNMHIYNICKSNIYIHAHVYTFVYTYKSKGFN